MSDLLSRTWHAVALEEELVQTEPFPCRLLNTEIVLWKHGNEWRAFRDLCLHRGTRLSLGKVSDGCLVCPYHGWRYDDSGQCVHIPAQPKQQPPEKAKVKSFPLKRRYGLIWVALEEPEQELPTFPEGELENFRLIPCGPYRIQASGPRVVENFLDVAHFPFVHDGLLGDSTMPEINDYTVEKGEDGLMARDIQLYQPDPDGTGIGKNVSYTYEVPRPLVAHFRKNTDGPQFAMFLAVCPHDEHCSSSFMIIAMNYGRDIPEQELREFQDRIVAQDRHIVESQRPELLPLDLTEELHLRSDRTAIAYRKWLRELGIEFGTA